jgi:hypothetical protein
MSRTGTIVAVSNSGHGMRLSAIRIACATLLCASAAAHGTAPAAAVGREVAQRACAALSDRVERSPGQGPVLLRSYDDSRGSGEPDDAVLRSAAFTYDNALAVISLLACDRRSQALRVGEALRMAAVSDIRLRNAYRAGPMADKPLSNGWWDTGQKRWLEDAYQAGTATGNVAWAALALLALHDATGQARWLGPRTGSQTGLSRMRRMLAAPEVSVAACTASMLTRKSCCGSRPNTTSTSPRCSAGSPGWSRPSSGTGRG